MTAAFERDQRAFLSTYRNSNHDKTGSADKNDLDGRLNAHAAGAH